MNNLTVYLLVAAAMFCLGLLAIMTRKNAIAALMGIELVLNAAALSFVAFGRFSAGNLQGQVAALFVIIVAAAEAAVALAVFLNLYRIKASTDLDQAGILKG